MLIYPLQRINQFLIDKGYLKPDTGAFNIGKAVDDGWDGQVAAYLMQGGLTAAEAQKQINFAGKYHQNGNWDSVHCAEGWGR